MVTKRVKCMQSGIAYNIQGIYSRCSMNHHQLIPGGTTAAYKQKFNRKDCMKMALCKFSLQCRDNLFLNCPYTVGTIQKLLPVRTYSGFFAGFLN